MAKTHTTKAAKFSYCEVPKPPWKRIKHLFPKPPKQRRRERPPLPNRWVLNAIGSVRWTGCQWEALPQAGLGVSGSAAHARFQKWQEMGLFEQVLAERVRFYDKRRKIGWKWQALDGKHCPAPLGGEETGRNPTDRGKRGSKIHLRVDNRGAPLAVCVSAANRHDKGSVHDLIFSLVVDRPDAEQHLCADRGYDYADIWDLLTLEHYQPHIKHRRRRGEPKVESCPIPGETNTQLDDGVWSAPSVGWPSVAAFAPAGARNPPTGWPSCTSPVLISISTWHFQDRYVVYTSHSIEPNGGLEREAIRELLRIARRAVVLVEPIYELADEAARQRMKSHGYARGLKTCAESLGANITDYRLLPYTTNPLNPSGVLVLEKEHAAPVSGGTLAWQCPLTHASLMEQADLMFAPKAGLAYPILRGVPLLRPQHAVVASWLG